MYRVIIIDDEPIIVKGLSKMLPWEKYGCEVVGTAEDGLEGLELIRQLQPHIIISDIYMPKMDGLAMAAAMKSEFEDTELTILTGYRDFALAQEAIRLGVRRFLLKPSNMEELEEAVSAMTAHLKRQGITGEDQEEKERRERKADIKKETAGFKDRTNLQNVQSSADIEDAGNKHAAAVDDSQIRKPEEDTAGSFVVKKALGYMQENYTKKLTLTEVADHTYVSQWHLSKLLNRHTGQSFSEHLNTIRITEAKKLLTDPSLRIGDIAEQVGFVDVGHFSRVFKKITGMSANDIVNIG